MSKERRQKQTKKTQKDESGESRQKRSKRVKWEVLDAFGSFSSAILAVFALFIGIYQFNLQNKELKREREERVKLDRPVVSIYKNSVYDFKGNKQINLELKNAGIRPAHSLKVSTITLRKNRPLSPLVYNQKNYTVDFTNPIFKEQGVNFINDMVLVVAEAEYYVKVSLQYFEESNEVAYKQDFYFKWKHTTDEDLSQNLLYGVEREVTEEIDNFIMNNQNIN